MTTPNAIAITPKLYLVGQYRVVETNWGWNVLCPETGDILAERPYLQAALAHAEARVLGAI